MYFLFHFDSFSGYIKNICNKETDYVLIIHAQEYPTIPAAPYPCKYNDGGGDRVYLVLSLCMGISDKIEVVMITIDETAISEIKVMN